MNPRQRARATVPGTIAVIAGAITLDFFTPLLEIGLDRFLSRFLHSRPEVVAILLVSPVGYAWITVACFRRSAAQTLFVIWLALCAGMVLGGLTLTILQHSRHERWIVFLFCWGFWIFNILGVEKLVRHLRSMRAIALEED